MCLCIRHSKNKEGGEKSAVPDRKHKRQSLKKMFLTAWPWVGKKAIWLN